MSIGGILKSLRTADNAHIHLMSCILFICIEALQGHISTVVHLVKAGYRILQEQNKNQPAKNNGAKQREKPRSDASAFLGFADRFLRRIIAQIYMLIRDLDPDITAIVTSILQPSEQSRSFDFASLADAQEGLSDIRLQFERCDMRGLVGKVSAWSTAFEEFKSLNSAALTSRANKRAVALLELQSRYCAVDIAISCAGDQADQLLWDRYIGAFTDMLGYAEKAMDLHDQASCSPQFHMHSGTVPVLYGIIAKCRDPTIRRRAIGLMTSRPLQEGVWNNNLVLGVARRIMATEEGSLGPWPASCKDIPAESRVRSIAVAAGAGDNQYMVGYQLGRGWRWEESDYIADCV
ncbi:hypothetical protein H634G_04895 [Metarhizium anisopliae BRIP 53293]|uniref:Uncharacterized protein n=1 Tax=Metarhizium anisopliae BRIP 53293 TaxID=1291518 RepID=A0A0D9NZ63_METAN|nr:hypothetical protein H634G_04895 [Metarhizium anisopliae BRIP 53293]KJK85642.1 hypothetical protein H633G_10506 [Metarhizium anisopliae BRIP 53284]